MGFTAGLTLPAQSGPLAVVSADFNGDGKADFAVSNATSATISIYLGNGDGTFQSLAPYALGGGCTPNYITAGDFNNDHKPDLLVNCGLNRSLAVAFGKGDGTFGKAAVTALNFDILAGNFVEAGFNPALADFDKDGNIDMVVALGDLNTDLFGAQAYLLRSAGDGTFHAPVQIPLPLPSLSFAAGDWNGDGNPDLAAVLISTSSQGNSTATLYTAQGDGKGGFATPTSHTLTANFLAVSLVAADLNGDGKPDLVLTGPVTDSLGNLRSWGIETFPGDGNGGFQPGLFSFGASGEYALGTALADLRGTGKPDLIEAAATLAGSDLSTSTGSVLVQENNGDGSFGTAATFPVPAGQLPFAVIAADINGDSQQDLAYVTIPAAGLRGLGTTGAPIFSTFPAGSLDFLINTTRPPTFSDTNAASFQPGALAVDSIASAFGSGFGPSTPASGNLPLPTMLDGVIVTVKDSAGVARQAPLFYVSSKQINFAVPAGTASGAGTVTITFNGATYEASQQIAAVAPGVFAAAGLAAGSVLTIHNGVQTLTNLITTDSAGNLVPAPVSVGSGSDLVFLELYGTGIRHHQNPVTATIAGTKITAAYADTQGTFVGEDQINLLLPQSLKGAGLAEVILTADGQTANSVKVRIE